MQNQRELFLETIKKGGKPDRLVDQYEPFAMVFGDPIGMWLRSGMGVGQSSVDRWGTTYQWPAGQPAGMPHITNENKAIKDITKWRDEIKVPDIMSQANGDWSMAKNIKAKIDSKEKLSMVLWGTGVFEQLHYLMGFEDTLANMLLEEDDMLDLCEAIGDYKLTYIKLLIENIRPDAVLSHDDWGAKHSLFMSPEAWRKYLKPQYEKIYGYIKSQDVILLHHADSFLEPIIEDMVDVGIDVWQGALPQNDLIKVQKQLNGRMALMGGIDTALLDHVDTTEEAIRAETRRACETYGPGGHFIPSHTYGGPNDVIHKHIYPIISDEIARYNKDTYGI